ncbi:MAG: (d)CMP kinase [Flavobacteriaceae bacterium]|nr:cytidylate kinase [uncultured bacterium]MBT3919246.1 (d)CMP kinase [Flavobacteriaceae bacterium]MBT6705218.1 (d)CMP kinase [Flavobacteriaceae bacterium]MBT7242844.1 (d)CMP kinase [Flavobacteriaceae bacterium]
MKKIIIAIDGYSSTGKSTVAKQLADYLDYIYVDSGAMYRAVTLFALQNNYLSKDNFDKESLIKVLPEIQLDFKKENADSKANMFLNGVNVEKEIRTMYVSDFVSPIATLSEVRKKLVAIQHQMGIKKGIVMDGRDIGTVVFPKAELKIFMTADAEVRAMRRFNELKEKDETITYDEILKNVQKRDLMDTTREDSPLIIANDAIEIDNSETNEEDQFHIILQLAKDRVAGRI